MAATTQNQSKDAKMLRFPRPLKGGGKNRGKAQEKKRLPALTSADIEDFFTNADAMNKNRKIAA